MQLGGGYLKMYTTQQYVIHFLVVGVINGYAARKIVLA
jgi:hypothetical protein